MTTKIFEMPGKAFVEWDSDVNAIIVTSLSYAVTLNEFKEIVIENGFNYAKAKKAKAWIVDSSSSKGVFSQEIQEFIMTNVFPAFTNAGIQYFFTVDSESSALTNFTISAYNKSAQSSGLKVAKASSVQQIIDWLKKNG